MLDDPKIQRLSDRDFRTWINLLCAAGAVDDGGIIGDDDDVAFLLRLPPSRACSALRRLQKIGVVDRRAGVWTITNFARRQARPSDNPEAWRDRKRRQRDREKTEGE